MLMPVFHFSVFTALFSTIFWVRSLLSSFCAPPFWDGKQYPFCENVTPRFLESYQPVLDSDLGSSVYCVGHPVIPGAYLTYDTSWAPPSKVVYSSNSAYILSMGGPNGNGSWQCWCWYMLYPPHYTENEIPNLGSFSARLYSLSSMGNWVSNAGSSSAHSSTQRAAKLQSFIGQKWIKIKDSHCIKKKQQQQKNTRASIPSLMVADARRISQMWL